MSPWTEPATSAPRWWGNYHARYGAGLALIVLGIAFTVLSSTYSLWFLLAGPVTNAIGWLLLPGSLWRRLVVLVPCILGGMLLLGGPQFAGGFALVLAGWLFVRHRPPISYLALLLPIGAAFAFKEVLQDYSQNWVMLSVGTVVAVGAAWLGRWLAVAREVHSQSEAGLR